MPPDAIRIHANLRDLRTDRDKPPREAFWAAVRQESDSQVSATAFEAKLQREFGPALREALLGELAAPIRQLDAELFPGSPRDFEHWFFRFIDGPRPERDRYWSQFVESFARIMEQRHELLRESPGLRRARERMVAAGSVTFATRIVDYSSLNFDLSVGSLRQAAAVFDNDFDSFRVFLEAFVPAAFAAVFSSESSDKLQFGITIPPTFERQFRDSPPISVTHAPESVIQAASTSTRERAEWLWRLANGSLLVPLLLALLVMYQGMKMLGEIRASQYEALRPVLDHQLKLLEEDRTRLAPQGSPRRSTP